MECNLNQFQLARRPRIETGAGRFARLLMLASRKRRSAAFKNTRRRGAGSVAAWTGAKWPDVLRGIGVDESACHYGW